jgi:hypothetical protein
MTALHRHSAQISMTLHVAGTDWSVAQMGPDFVILSEVPVHGCEVSEAEITLVVDDRVKRFPVQLPTGISAGDKWVKTLETVAA